MAIICPAYLSALAGRGVHVFTANDDLSKRDRDRVASAYGLLGMEAGLIQSGHTHQEKRAAYACDVTFGTSAEFGFDYLRDNLCTALDQQVQRGCHFAIIDEVEAILIDEARTPLTVSGPVEEWVAKYRRADSVARELRPCHFELDETERVVRLTDEGIREAQRLLGDEPLDYGRYLGMAYLIENSLHAYLLCQRGRDYAIQGDKVVATEETGARPDIDWRWMAELRRAIETKEGIPIESENQMLGTITYRSFFKLYDKLGGIASGVGRAATELRGSYGLEVMAIPTGRPCRRKDYSDVVYRTAKEKWDAIGDEVADVHFTGRPVLVGVACRENAEMLSRMLRARGIEHRVLDARGAEMLDRVGHLGQVTITTSLCYRSAEISLGRGVAEGVGIGSAPPLRGWRRSMGKVQEVGGLHVVGAERYEAHWIDDQLRACAGQRGEPGSSRFFLSLEDDLVRILTPRKAAALRRRFGSWEEGTPVVHRALSRAFDRAQRKCEKRSRGPHSIVSRRDQLIDDQCRVVYALRQRALSNDGLAEVLWEMVRACIRDHVSLSSGPGKSRDTSDWPTLEGWLQRAFGREAARASEGRPCRSDIEEALLSEAQLSFEAREQTLAPEVMQRMLQSVLLTKIDENWRRFLYVIERLRYAMSYRYDHEDPLSGYRRHTLTAFETMAERTRREVIDAIFGDPSGPYRPDQDLHPEG